MEMPGQGFLFIATVLVPENAGTKAQLPKIEVTRKHWDIYISYCTGFFSTRHDPAWLLLAKFKFKRACKCSINQI
jgi:hypothetical protein